uniref:U-SLPTX-Sm2a n=1 Tax=Scolopendra morsitans TaxID=943129 RepID=A0A023VZF7_SCOMO|nr:U-SLPTX-Sm2a [Scolopendra morsitans]AHY22588.1 U-SLPTX-Sm2a [Scolopendra morsitans]
MFLRRPIVLLAILLVCFGCLQCDAQHPGSAAFEERTLGQRNAAEKEQCKRNCGYAPKCRIYDFCQ